MTKANRRARANREPEWAASVALASAWNSRATDVKLALFNIEFDELRLAVSLSPEMNAGSLDIRIHRVVDERPWFIASLIAVGPRPAGQCAAAGWQQWRRPWNLQWRRRPLPLQDVEDGERILCAHRSKTPDGVVREVFRLLTDHLHFRGACRPHLEIVNCSWAEAARRLTELDDIGLMASRPRPGSSRKPAVAYCNKCGQPLSDPESLSWGMGPECRRRYLTEAVRGVHKYPDIERRLWVGAVPMKTWRRETKARLDALAHLPSE
jgi:hypothetical protein